MESQSQTERGTRTRLCVRPEFPRTAWTTACSACSIQPTTSFSRRRNPSETECRASAAFRQAFESIHPQRGTASARVRRNPVADALKNRLISRGSNAPEASAAAAVPAICNIGATLAPFSTSLRLILEVDPASQHGSMGARIALRGTDYGKRTWRGEVGGGIVEIGPFHQVLRLRHKRQSQLLARGFLTNSLPHAHKAVRL